VAPKGSNVCQVARSSVLGTDEKERTMTITDDTLQAASVFTPDVGVAGSHERVVFGHDRATGLSAIIAVHSTLLGPALGGTRFYPYASEALAVHDVLRLSRGMTYKAAAAGLSLGGGKAVILGDPSVHRTDALLEAYGRLVESLAGSYITAGDVGTTSADMDVIGRTTDHVVARTPAAGGSGDSAPLTAYGVFQSMRAAAQSVWGDPSLEGRLVGVEGLGKVGRNLVGLLTQDGARVVAADVSAAARERVAAELIGVSFVDDVLDAPLDVYAPCALGATVTRSSASTLSASIVCGAANNQLSHDDVEGLLVERGITWVPDYVANAGGLIQVAGERERLGADAVREQVSDLFGAVAGILATARSRGIAPGRAADEIAEQRLRSAADGRSA
jgi:valine dehydrogenase (NAD+)